MLSRILFPMTEEEFFRDYWTKAFLHIPGSPDKFSELFPWETLNRALEEHQFHEERLKLVKAGSTVSRASFMNGPWVNASKLVNELAGGATLILVGCEEVYPPLRELCVYLERLFHVRVQVNLYAGWREDNGFDVHWDTQDVLILQVSGRKRWKIWNPTRLHPFTRDAVDTSENTRPTEAPVWDEVIEPGGMFNIPRGWWHIANPVNEPCMHLTVTICNLNGIDFLDWIKEKMKASEAARMELPVVATPMDRILWLDRVKQDLDAMWRETLVDEFIAYKDMKTIPRPALSLPFAADQRNHGLKIGTPVRLAIPRPLHFLLENETASLTVNGSEWQIKPYVAEKLQRFNDLQPHTLAELTPESDFRVITMVMALVRGGVLRPDAT